MVEKKDPQKTESKRFYKSRKDKMIDGVCGGLAEYLNVDVNVIRILWLISIFLKGLGIVAYVLAMIIVPVNPAHRELKEEEKKKRNPVFFWGLLLIIIGFLFLFQRWELYTHWHYPWRFRFLPWWGIPWGAFWPLGLVALGVAYIIYILRREKKEPISSDKDKTMGDSGKKLVRTVDDKVIGGVCGGIGRYFNIDSTVVRIVLAVIALATDVLLWIIIYAILYIALPQGEVKGVAVSK